MWFTAMTVAVAAASDVVYEEGVLSDKVEPTHLRAKMTVVEKGMMDRVGEWWKEKVLGQKKLKLHDLHEPTQLVTFATPYRIEWDFARANGQALVSTMQRDFSEKGFEPMVNLGEGRVWTANYKEKITFLREFVEKPENAEKVIMFADGEDVIMGGCHKSELLERYKTIVDKSGGAKIVFGAELWCFEPPNGECPEPARAEWAEREYDGRKLDAKLNSFKNEQSSKDNTTSYTNLNSGFFIGPAKDLLEMLHWSEDEARWAKLHPEGSDYYGDQRMYSQYWFEHPDKVTLDYGAELVLTANGFKRDALMVDTEGDVVNKMFDRKQCVVHGNGYAKSAVGDIQMQRAKAKGDTVVQLILQAHCLAMPETCSQGEAVVSKLKMLQKDMKEGIERVTHNNDMGGVFSDTEDELKKLKASDPASFMEVTKKFISNDPVFHQLMEQLF